MLLKSIKSFFAVAFLTLVSLSSLQAQRIPKCLKVAKSNRPNWVLIDNGQLSRFHKNFEEEIAFSEMKLIKSDLAYYLIAKEKNASRIFAYELEQKGKRLFLNRLYPVQTCSEGELSLDTFLQMDGKIKGCRIGTHTIRQKQ